MIRLRKFRGEDGSSLVLALVFLSLFGLFVAALLSFTDTSFKSTTAVHDQGKSVYAADGAVDQAINTIRPTSTEGVQGACTNSYPSTLNGIAVRVECVGESGSGQVVGTGGTTPQAAIITLSTSASERTFTMENQTLATIDGGVFARRTINLGTGAVLTIPTGKATAVSGCTPTDPSAQIVGAFDCNSTAPPVTDPNYALPGSAPTQAAEPGFPAGCPSQTVVALPGNRVYSDRNALQDLLTMTGTHNCSGSPSKIFWFQPGVHYFNFSAATPDLDLATSGNVYVAGARLGWDDTTNIQTVRNLSQRCDTNASGAELVFGGYTRLRMKNGYFEICPPTAPGPRIAIYGVKTTTQGYAAQVGCAVNIPENCTTGAGAFLDLFSTGGSSSGAQMSFVSRGTVYAPISAVEIRLPDNSGIDTFTRGVIVRTLLIGHTNATNLAAFSCGSQGCGAGTPANRKVTFTACPAAAASPCPESQKLLRATVEYDDVNGSNPGQFVNVVSWSVLK